MDEKDRRILEVLVEDSSRTTRQVAKLTNLPITTVHNRIKRLEQSGIIQRYTAIVDHKKLGKDVLAYILVNISHQLPSGKVITWDSIAQNVKKLKGVREVYITTGASDLIVKIRLKNIDELNDFIVHRIRSVQGVTRTSTMIVLSTI